MPQKPQTYECVEIDVITKKCTNWQLVDSSIPKAPPLTQDDVNQLTFAILSFMAVVYVYYQIKQTVKEMMK